MGVAFFVTNSTKCHEIFFAVIAQKAAGLFVVNVQILSATAILTAPTVTFEDCIA